MMIENLKTKAIFTFFAFCILFSLVITKAFFVQVINRDKLIAYSDSQFFRKIKVYPKRGNLLDRNGEPLAINVQTYSIFTIPKETKAGAYRKMAKIVPELAHKTIMKKVKGRRNYTWLARKIKLSDDQVKELKKIEGIFVEAIPSRFYPNHELAAQILGFVGIDNNGLAGLEYSMDEKLRGEAQVIKYLKDAKGRPVRYESRPTSLEAEDIFLSIDKELQAALEKHLKEGVLLHDADKGGAGVMDVETGEILAMANYPTFDPNEPQQYPTGHKRMSFVSDPFEPGSTFKAITIASALENKIVKRDSSFYCEKGKMKVDDHVISEALDSEKFEWLTVEEILKFSSNIGTTKIAFDLTYPRLQKSIKNFKFGQKSGIEIPAESKGIFLEKENVRPLSLSNISFGQGIATTAVQMMAAYAAIANGGEWIKPTLIKVVDKEKIEKTRILSRKTSESMVKMLTKAVEDGTGKPASIPHFTIAGKTSTAQRVSPNGGYKGYISGFVGFPVNVDKKFVIFVYVDNPKNGIYFGGSVAAPIFKKIAQNILYKRESFNEIANVNQREIAPMAVDKVEVSSSSIRREEIGKVPNFIGLDKSSALEMAKRNRIDLKTIGYGIVRSQTPEQGSPIDENQEVSVIFESPNYE